MPHVPLRPTTVRLASDAMAIVQRAAKEAGVSPSQFIREAAIMRAAAILGEGPLLSDEGQHLARGHDDP